MQYSTDVMIAKTWMPNILFSEDHKMAIFQISYKEQSNKELFLVVSSSMQTGYLMLLRELIACIDDYENK